ncbi:hypothetical protein V2J09_006991 [Rumex salicifolius]
MVEDFSFLFRALKTFMLKDESSQHNIHYWFGREANEVDSGMASDKALELDMALGSCTVQYKEIQGQETEKFLSYFKPCIIPIEGVFTLDLDESNNGTYRASLLACKERAKALEVVKYIKDDKHNGNCKIATLEDGKFVGDSDVGEFWSLFGGYAPIPKDSPSFFQSKKDASIIKLVTLQGKLSEILADSLHKKLLSNDKCYMLDCEAEVYIWMGKITSVSERKNSISTVEGFLRSQERSNISSLTVLTEGLETPKFRSYFMDWSPTEKQTLYEEGRKKVAAMFKQKGFVVKELPEEEEEECSPSIACSGTVKVWKLNNNEIHEVPAEKNIKLFSADCYIMQYTYPGSESNEHIFYTWLGRESVMEDRVDALSQMIIMANSIKGASVLGGASERYKNHIAENGIQDQTYNNDTKIALFRVQGVSPEDMQAIQVEPVSSSLNSSYCFIFQTETTIYTWMGDLTSSRDHELLDRMLELINSSWQSLSLREGREPEEFWKSLGGKAEYPKEKKIKNYAEDPCLLLCHTITEGDLKVKEIFNFGQDDLTTEDVFILDCNKEVYVWIGCHSNKYLETDVLGEGQSPETPLYVITEGNEPKFFTQFFAWDHSKTKIHGNSFERKLALLRGEEKQKMEGSPKNSWRGSISPRLSVNQMPFSRRFSSPIPSSKNLFSEDSPNYHPHSGEDNATQEDSFENVDNSLIFPYEQLILGSSDPPTGIDITKREMYLSEEEFQEKFGITKKAFYRLPKWRQNKLKVSLYLF